MVTRRRVVWGALALLLVLDGGRSLWARYGRLPPPRPPASSAAWPPGIRLRADAPAGERIYARHCAVCHGADGHGDGPASASLHPRPRDFSGGVFKLKSTPAGEPPTRDDVRHTIGHGVRGGSMPAWEDLLSADEIDAVTEHVRHLGPLAEWSPPQRSLAVPPELLAQASAERGRDLYRDLGCAACHGAQGKGDGAAAAALKDVWKQPAPPRDLTAPWTFADGDAPETVYRRILFGVPGTPMPGYAESATPADVAAVVAYLRRLARLPAWEPGGALSGPGQAAEPLRRGEYLVRIAACGRCHTPVDAAGTYRTDSHFLAGGTKVDAGAHGFFYAANLTADADTGLGRWSVAQIATALRSGHAPDRRLNFWGMPWMVFGQLGDDDALAIATYLKSVPAVRNRVPRPVGYGFVETVVRKLAYDLPALVPERLAYGAGNFGDDSADTASTGWQPDLPQTLLVRAQWFVLFLALLAWFLGAAPEHEDSWRRGLGVVRLMLLVVVGGGAVVLYRYPALDGVPTRSVVDAFAAGTPPAPTEGRPPHEAALLQRGRYLYGISSCSWCHNGSGAGGGKVNGPAFGTAWAANLTAHSTGLKNESDAAVLRALGSGVRRDGRALHWRATLWDSFSSLALEDQRALLAYLRSLPPVERTLPAAVPPGAGDCGADTFWIAASSSEAGCR